MSDFYSAVILFGGIGIAYYHYMIVPEQKRNRKREEEKLNPTPKTETVSKSLKPDFHGTRDLEEDPSGFIKRAKVNQRKLESGEEVSVNATTAFFLMRNIKHHGLIVDESGKVNMKTLREDVLLNDEKTNELKDKILSFQPDGRSDKDTKKLSLPAYVKKEEIINGGVRWVFTEKHAKDCGFDSICIDSFGRAMPDPENIDDGAKKKTEKKDKKPRDVAQIDALSNDVAMLLEMQKEERAKNLLKETLPSCNTNEKNSSPIDAPAFLDDAAILEKELVLPDFESGFLDTAEECANVIADNIGFKSEETESLNLVHEENKNEAAVECDLCEYSFELITDVSSNYAADLFDTFLQHALENNCFGNIFIDEAKTFAYIEKNFFAKGIKTFLDRENKLRFDVDFLLHGSIEIYDGKKLDQVLAAMNINQRFVSYGQGKKNILCNVLFELPNQKSFMSGWFIKVTLHEMPTLQESIALNDDYVAMVVSTSPREIKTRVQALGNIEIKH